MKISINSSMSYQELKMILHMIKLLSGYAILFLLNTYFEVQHWVKCNPIFKYDFTLIKKYDTFQSSFVMLHFSMRI